MTPKRQGTLSRTSFYPKYESLVEGLFWKGGRFWFIFYAGRALGEFKWEVNSFLHHESSTEQCDTLESIKFIQDI